MHGAHGGTRVAVLLAALSALLLLGGAQFGPAGLLVGLLLAIALHGSVWFGCDRVALRAVQAYPVSEAQQPTMYRIVRELSTATRRPMPRLYVSPTPAPNAFATGRDPRHAAIVCTEGVLARLDERELRAVLAHELAHVHNRDILVSSVAAALATGVMFLAQLSWLVPGGTDDDDGGGLLGGMMMVVLGPLAAGVLRLAVSRSREYGADAAGAALTGDPLGLAAALRSLDAGTRDVPLRPEPGLRSASALMVVDPFRPDRIGRLFRSHPPIAERIARLEALAGYRR